VNHVASFGVNESEGNHKGIAPTRPILFCALCIAIAHNLRGLRKSSAPVFLRGCAQCEIRSHHDGTKHTKVSDNLNSELRDLRVLRGEHPISYLVAANLPNPSKGRSRPAPTLHCYGSDCARLGQIFREAKALGFGDFSRQGAKTPSSEGKDKYFYEKFLP
jgi:hypothetical protein